MDTSTSIRNNPNALSLRRVGPWCLLAAGSVALVLTAAAAFADPGLALPGNRHYAASGLVMTPVDLLVALGFAALAAGPAVASGHFKRIAFALLIAGSFAMVPAEALLRVDFTLGNSVFGIAGPVQALGLILVGIGILRTRRWSSWRKFAPLLMGAYIPAVMMPWLILAQGKGLAPLAGYHLLVLLTGLAYLIEDRLRA